MSEEDAAEKEYEPTEHKLTEARRKGDLVRSSEIAVAAVYGGFLLAIAAVGHVALEQFGSRAMVMLDRADSLSKATFSGGSALGMGAMFSMLAPVAPFLLGPLIAALVAYWAQRAIVAAPEKLQPKLSRINPMANAVQKFGRNGLFEFAKSTVKLIVISVVLAFYLRAKLDEILVSQRLSPGQSSGMLMEMIVEFLALVTGLAALMGAVDYFWQRADFLRRNRMSRKELMDEMKQSEGDPHLKGQRRQRGIEIATGQTLRDAAQADVIIVNPTHYAVALKWDRESGRAPTCVAKGMDALAARIREIAAESGVPIHSDPPTARALYAVVEVGEDVRPEHYKPVAAAIRFAEKMRARAGRRRS
ncbi:flagellar biosynthesis protein FlhB [Thioclava sp. BHET1]|nr:flagellar biosynthesis protein FlhB [Thioclava sp. BHET1]